MRILLSLLDRIVFTIGFLLFLQLPNYVDHYTQRMGGYHAADRDTLAEYQQIANDNHAGELSELIEAFASSADAAVVDTGENLRQLRRRVEDMNRGLIILEGGAFPRKLAYLSTNLRSDIALGTARAYVPGLPFTIEALVCGLIGGILATLLFNAPRGWRRGWRWLRDWRHERRVAAMQSGGPAASARR